MIHPDTPPGTQIVCIRNGPICADNIGMPLPTIGSYYTVKSITPTYVDGKHAVFLDELPSYTYIRYGRMCIVGCSLKWFRPIDKQVDLLMETFNSTPVKEREEALT